MVVIDRFPIRCNFSPREQYVPSTILEQDKFFCRIDGTSLDRISVREYDVNNGKECIHKTNWLRCLKGHLFTIKHQCHNIDHKPCNICGTLHSSYDW